MTATVQCRGCETMIEQRGNGSGRQRIWCSDKCRKRTLYSGTCPDCGGRTDGVASGKARESERCISCARVVHAERNERIFEAWAEGEPGWLIGKREGMTEGAVISLVGFHRRRNGCDLPLHRGRNRVIWPEIERRWNAGQTAGRIAADLGANAANIMQTVQTMRDAGIELREGDARQGEWESRRELLVRRWSEGASSQEIASEMGITYGGLSALVSRLRKQGYNLPYRRKVTA